MGARRQPTTAERLTRIEKRLAAIEQRLLENERTAMNAMQAGVDIAARLSRMLETESRGK
jgi:hypothetical protein